MTGVLQSHARKYSIPIDTLTFGFKVTSATGPADVIEGPEVGVMIAGSQFSLGMLDLIRSSQGWGHCTRQLARLRAKRATKNTACLRWLC